MSKAARLRKNACQRRYYARNRAALNKESRRRYAANRKYWADRQRARRAATYPKPTRPLPSRCECCGRKPRKRLHLDHCHLTFTFRGWLCSNCNTGIGLLGDSIEGLKLAIKYLRR